MAANDLHAALFCGRFFSCEPSGQCRSKLLLRTGWRGATPMRRINCHIDRPTTQKSRPNRASKSSSASLVKHPG
jgi:hypothetical protein